MANQPTSDLPKPKHKTNPEKERWLKSIQEYARAQKTETISLQEYRLLQKLAFKFKCPLNYNPLTCNEKNCPTKPNPPFNGYFWDCREHKKYRIKLLKVQKGKIKVE